MSESPIDRLVAIVRRDLGTEDVRILDADEREASPTGDSSEIPSGDAVLSCALSGGKRILVVFPSRPDDAAARLRRLEILVESFGDLVSRSGPPQARPNASMTLHLELETLARRAAAKDALVIDARSPIVWGASAEEMSMRATYEPDVVSLPERPSTPPIERVGGGAAISHLDIEPSEPREADALSLRAISAVRGLGALASLHRGGHLHHTVRDESFGFIARSFASIYVLIVVFDAPFDELRAERAIGNELPIVERLVMALPPLDPTPMAGAMAIRRRRRR